MEVIKEIDEITSLTEHQDALNKVVAENFNKEEQKQMIMPVLKRLLIDELLHVIAIMKVEKEKMNLLGSDCGD